AGGQSREDLLVARDLLGDERLPQPRRWRGLLSQLHQQLGGDDALEGVRQPFVREVCVGHLLPKVRRGGRLGEVREVRGGCSARDQPLLTSPNLHSPPKPASKGFPKNRVSRRRRAPRGAWRCRIPRPSETRPATRTR